MKTPRNTINTEFEHAFSEIEQLLKRRLNQAANSRVSFSILRDQYAQKHPYWVESADRLKTLGDIRNILVHQKSLKHGAPFTVTKASLNSLNMIKLTLEKQPSVSERYTREVIHVSIHDTLEHVVRLSYEHDFSQFPVLDKGRFVGLITENEIVRWLGHMTAKSGAVINLATVHVNSVLREKAPDMKDIRIFRFERLNAFLPEVMSWFSREPSLEAILLTKTGKNSSPIEGIITQWDAARHII